MAPGHLGAIPGAPAPARARPRRSALLVALAGRAVAIAASVVACVAAMPGCGAGEGSIGSDPQDAPRGDAGTARSGGLTATLVVSPAAVKPGGVVAIELLARARNAPGAVGYQLRYGDGTGAGSGAVPQFCVAGPGLPTHRVWRLKHRYRAAGRYVVSASVYVNCTRDHATANASVRVVADAPARVG